MEWWVSLLLFFSGLVVLLLLRVPVAFALLAITGAVAAVFFGPLPGLRRMVLSAESTLGTFSLVPIPLFILMGDVLFRSGVATKALDVIDSVIGRVPGRMGVLTVSAGALFGIVSGSTLANTALLARTLLPDMLRRGYSQRLAMGAVLGSGGLAMIIPPSALAVIWGATAGVPIGPLLIAGLLPGLLMAFGYLVIVLGWSVFFRGAPIGTEGNPLPMWLRTLRVIRYVLPLGSIVLVVLGSIFFGVATPTESAALGAVASVFLAIAYRKFSLQILRDSLVSAARLTSMLFLILMAAGLYSQVMAFSGATSGVVRWLTTLPVDPLIVLLLIMIMLLVMGLFLEQIAIMLITIPFLMPVVTQFGWDPLWFGVLMLINLQVALTTPPLGMTLFVMKGLVPASIPLTEIYRAALPFVFSDMIVMAALVAFPGIATWLPELMRG